MITFALALKAFMWLLTIIGGMFLIFLALVGLAALSWGRGWGGPSWW